MSDRASCNRVGVIAGSFGSVVSVNRTRLGVNFSKCARFKLRLPR